jgi:hypothetical protein
MPKSRRPQHNDLTTCYHQFLETARGESNAPIPAVDRERRRTLARLAKRGITTVGDLLHQWPDLPTALRFSAIELIWLLKLRPAVANDGFHFRRRTRRGIMAVASPSDSR